MDGEVGCILGSLPWAAMTFSFFCQDTKPNIQVQQLIKYLYLNFLTNHLLRVSYFLANLWYIFYQPSSIFFLWQWFSQHLVCCVYRHVLTSILSLIEFCLLVKCNFLKGCLTFSSIIVPDPQGIPTSDYIYNQISFKTCLYLRLEWYHRPGFQNNYLICAWAPAREIVSRSNWNTQLLFHNPENTFNYLHLGIYSITRLPHSSYTVLGIVTERQKVSRRKEEIYTTLKSEEILHHLKTCSRSQYVFKNICFKKQKKSRPELGFKYVT